MSPLAKSSITGPRDVTAGLSTSLPRWIFREPNARRVKWLDPAAIVRWRDLGLRGRDLAGRRDRSWKGRNEQRDTAFVDGLYGTGLRLTEWGSVVLPELPCLEVGRSFYTCQLADRCAKGGYGHAYWFPFRAGRRHGVHGLIDDRVPSARWWVRCSAMTVRTSPPSCNRLPPQTSLPARSLPRSASASPHRSC